MPATPEEQKHQIEQLTNLAKRLAAVGRTREAVPYLAKAYAPNPSDTVLSLKVAALQAWFGQEKDLAATLQRIRAVRQGHPAMCSRPSARQGLQSPAIHR